MNVLRACLASVCFIGLASCATERRTDPPGPARPQATARPAEAHDRQNAAAARIGPRDARSRVESGAALLVCAYDNPEKFRRNHLQGAIALEQLKGREAGLAKETEIIFYCA
jgi:hypothetical protein